MTQLFFTFFYTCRPRHPSLRSAYRSSCFSLLFLFPSFFFRFPFPLSGFSVYLSSCFFLLLFFLPLLPPSNSFLRSFIHSPIHAFITSFPAFFWFSSVFLFVLFFFLSSPSLHSFFHALISFSFFSSFFPLFISSFIPFSMHSFVYFLPVFLLFLCLPFNTLPLSLPSFPLTFLPLQLS